jgi:hypothetical protein
MDFGIIDTTPSHGFRVACVYRTSALTTFHTQRFFDASAWSPHAAIAFTSLTSREIGFDSGFWFLGGLRRGSPQMIRITSSAQRTLTRNLLT